MAAEFGVQRNRSLLKREACRELCNVPCEHLLHTALVSEPFATHKHTHNITARKGRPISKIEGTQNM